jgi:hypothetical protein
MDDLLARLRGALLPLEAPPGPRGWNHADMAELIGAGPRRAAAVLIGIRDDRTHRHAAAACGPGRVSRRSRRA